MKRTVTLTRQGENLALVLDPSLLSALHIDEHTQLEISANEDSLVVRPAGATASNIKINDALDWMDANYSEALRRLAE